MGLGGVGLGLRACIGGRSELDEGLGLGLGLGGGLRLNPGLRFAPVLGLRLSGGGRPRRFLSGLLLCFCPCTKIPVLSPATQGRGLGGLARSCGLGCLARQ